MKYIVNIVCMLSLAISTSASTVATNKSLYSISKKYEYLLTSHPNAHLESFRKEKVELYQAELKDYFKDKGIEEARADLLDIIAKVPEDDKRRTFFRRVKNASEEELIQIFSNKTLIRNTFKGEGSNFTSSDLFLQKAILYTILGVIVYAIADNVFDRINYETFDSFRLHAGDYCDTTPAEDEAMKADAYNKCVSFATYPETCRFKEWKTEKFEDYTTYDSFGNSTTYYNCYIEARYKADRDR